MCEHVDQPGNEKLASAIDHLRAAVATGAARFADLSDPAASHQYRVAFQDDFLRHGNDACVVDDIIAGDGLGGQEENRQQGMEH